MFGRVTPRSSWYSKIINSQLLHAHVAIAAWNSKCLLASAVSNGRAGEYVVELWNDLDPRYGDFGVRVPAITTEELWERLAEFGIDDIHLLKLDCEGAEYTTLESLAENSRLPQVGWIRGEWHGRRHRKRLIDALAATHVAHVDPNPPHECGLFVGHRR